MTCLDREEKEVKEMEMRKKEIKEKDKYDYSVINRTVTGTVRKILKIFRENGFTG